MYHHDQEKLCSAVAAIPTAKRCIFLSRAPYTLGNRLEACLVVYESFVPLFGEGPAAGIPLVVGAVANFWLA